MFSDETYWRYGYDPFNKNNTRNVRNTKKNTYNCGGYALGTFSWYLPCEDDDWDCSSISGEVDMNTRSFMAVQAMLEHFAYRGIRLITNARDVRMGEYAFAFRLSSDGDFHFVRRYCNGCWYHKRGGTPWIDKMPKNEVFSEPWCGRYDGPIFLFAIQKRG